MSCRFNLLAVRCFTRSLHATAPPPSLSWIQYCVCTPLLLLLTHMFWAYDSRVNLCQIVLCLSYTLAPCNYCYHASCVCICLWVRACIHEMWVCDVLFVLCHVYIWRDFCHHIIIASSSQSLVCKVSMLSMLTNFWHKHTAQKCRVLSLFSLTLSCLIRPTHTHSFINSCLIH